MEFRTIDGIKMVPGTVRIVDLDGTLNVKHQEGGEKDIILVPQPTSDPNDPLNWSKARKEYHFWLLWIWGFISAVTVNWTGPVWGTLTLALNTTFGGLNTGSALCYLFLGVGCVVLQPIAMKIGRRPIYIAGTVFNLVGNIMGGLVQTIGVYFGVKVLTGFGAAPIDSLVQVTTTDIYFAHERGSRLSLYVFTMYAGSYLGPVASGYIAESQGWRWCFWYLVIFLGILLVIMTFTLEETSFRRPPASSDIITEASLTEDKLGNSEKGAEETSITTESNPPPPKSYWQRMTFFSTSSSDARPLWLVALSPFYLVTYPAVMWAGFQYGVQIMWLSLTTVTQSLLFGNEPFNFSVSNVGNLNFASFVGGVVGMFWGGWVSDKCIMYLSRRNKGILEPEFRLWAMLVPSITSTAGLLMYGFGALYGVHWVLPGIFGLGFISFGIGGGAAIAIAYAIDCYPHIASEGLVLMLFLRNIIGTIFTFAIDPWLAHNGLRDLTIIMAILCFVSNMSFLLMVWKGKSMREWTVKRYLRMVEAKNKSMTGY